jgi:hypothetical protein
MYLRDQAAKCHWHAQRLGNAETQVELLKLVDEYAEQAAEIEIDEGDVSPRPPTLSFRARVLRPQTPNLQRSKAAAKSGDCSVVAIFFAPRALISRHCRVYRRLNLRRHTGRALIGAG